MVPTKSMILAARRVEYDYYQKGRLIDADRFIPTPDPVIKVMLEAALRLVETVGTPITTRQPPPAVEEPVPTKQKSAIVEARKPRPRPWQR